MNLTEDQLEEFDEAFNFFDSDRDGLINEKTLGKMFKFTLRPCKYRGCPQFSLSKNWAPDDRNDYSITGTKSY